MIADNLDRVRATIADACARAGRDPAGVTLVAVSKTQPPAALLEAAAAGVQHFGENRVEEGESKIPLVNAALAQPPVWHMIGHIQSRKAKQVLPLFDVVHSVDSLRLAERLARLADEHGKRLPVLLEINVSGEASKSGFAAFNWAKDAEARARLWDELRPLWALTG